MFRLNKKVFIALLSFCGFLTANCVSLNNEPCMTRSTLIDLDPVELNHYQFMMSIKNLMEVAMLLMAYQQQSKAKDVNVDLFNMITKIIEAKVLVKQFSPSCK